MSAGLRSSLGLCAKKHTLRLQPGPCLQYSVQYLRGQEHQSSLQFLKQQTQRVPQGNNECRFTIMPVIKWPHMSLNASKSSAISRACASSHGEGRRDPETCDASHVTLLADDPQPGRRVVDRVQVAHLVGCSQYSKSLWAYLQESPRGHGRPCRAQKSLEGESNQARQLNATSHLHSWF